MSLPKSSAAGGMVYGIVVGGHDGDPAPDQSNNLRVYFPGIHGKDVKKEHLAFSPRMMSPTKHDQQSFSGGLDPGSLVVALKDTGSNQCQILGLANDINMRESRTPGNADLLSSIASIFNTELKISIPPTVKEVTEGGAKIRKIQEKGKNHSHDLLKGIPTHGALYPMVGMVLPQLQNISTATQAFNQVLTDDMVKNIPGMIMSLGSMFNMLSGGPLKSILNKMPKEVGYALQSMSTLVQSVESTEGAGFSTSGRVDQGTFMSNAEKLFSQATNLYDMVGAMQRLQSDTSLFGQDKLKPFVSNIPTPFGQVSQSIDFNGNLSLNVPDVVQKAVKAFSGDMASALKFPGVNPGENMFGGSAEQMFKMFNQLSPQGLQTAVKMAQQLNTSDIAKKFDSVIKETVKGGNPFSKMFK